MWDRLRKAIFGSDTPAAVRLPGDGSYKLEVVKESKYQDALAAACGGAATDGAKIACQAQLVPEDWHPYDRTAVQVLIGGRRVGYLHQPDAIAYRWHLRQLGSPEAVGTCAARIVVESGQGHDGNGRFAVRLDFRLSERDLAQRAAAYGRTKNGNQRQRMAPGH
jgi:hypothetical protein